MSKPNFAQIHYNRLVWYSTHVNRVEETCTYRLRTDKNRQIYRQVTEHSKYALGMKSTDAKLPVSWPDSRGRTGQP